MHRIFLFLAFASSVSPIADAAETAGRVVSLSGEAHASAEGGGKRALKAGDSFSTGDTLETAAGSSAKLLFTDRTLLDLGEKSSFRVDQYRLRAGADREVDLNVQYGKIRALVNQKVADPGRFRVRTKSATMGVRGTEFVVASGAEGESQVTVLEGGVSVTALNGSVLSLSAGNELRAKGDEAPTTRALTKEEVHSAREASRTEDHSFQEAVSLESGGNGGLSTLSSVSTNMETASAKDLPPTATGFRPGSILPLNPNFQGGTQLPPPPPLLDARAHLRVTFTP